jgi:hypothetical protein
MFIVTLLLGLFGLFNILIPIKRLGIRTRKRALLLAFLGFALASAFSHLWHYSLPPEEKARIDAEAAARAVEREQRRAEKKEKVYATGCHSPELYTCPNTSESHQ